MFQFTHPGRGATLVEMLSDVDTMSFNSRTPGGVRLDISEVITTALTVSIHAPREGCDCKISLSRPRCRSFNSRTPGGVRLLTKMSVWLVHTVSIHAPREGCD